MKSLPKPWLVLLRKNKLCIVSLGMFAYCSPLQGAILLEINTGTNELMLTVGGGSSITSGTFEQWFVDDGNVNNETAASFLTITNFTKTGGTGLNSSADVSDFRLLKLFSDPSTVNSFVLGGTSAFSDWSGTITGTLSTGSLAGITAFNTINNNSRGSTSPALSGASFTPVAVPEPRLGLLAASWLILNLLRRKRTSR